LAHTVERIREISALIFGLAFIWIGLQHFTNVEFFLPIVPEIIGNPTFWVYLSGIVEIGLGVGLILRFSRKATGIATAIFLVIVYWANFNMWINDIAIDGNRFSNQAHVARALAQVAMIGFALWIADVKKKSV
tara:strand:- start:71572 stop:71970 length:399 start_codon:yes stop_codon:yes gene_type:complete